MALEVAHQMATRRNNTAPSAGSHIGVRGSTGAGEPWESAACASSVMRAIIGIAMKRAPKSAAVLGLVVGLAAATGARADNSKLPPIPGGDAGSQSQGQSKGSASADARRGLVTVEHDGKATGIGTVLSGDGRILTALSAVGASGQADVRYSDGHVVHAKLGHRDPAWDLALLVPQTGKWTDGLTASESDPSGFEVKAFVGGAKTAPVVAKVKGRVEALAKDGDLLVNALDLDMRTPPANGAGAPLVDATGSVVGILVRACKAPAGGLGAAAPPVAAAATPACAATFYGAPVPSIRSFLVRTPATAAAPTPPSPWLGIQGEPGVSGSTRGVRVIGVAPGSPASKAGLKANAADPAQAHMIVAVDGRPVDTPEKLGELIAKHAVGDSVKLLILDGDRLREVQVVLRASPQ